MLALRRALLREEVLLRRAARRVLARPGIDKVEAFPFLPPDPVIVEAGANIGDDTIVLAKLWPKGIVHAFEPIPHLFRQLEERMVGFANVRLYQSALGASTGDVSMWVSKGGQHGASSVRAPKTHLKTFPYVSFGERIEVPITTLDEWALRERIRRVDFFWLDMQGHELTALQHASTLLPSVRAILLEVFAEELYEGAPLWPEVREWLAGHGFIVVRSALGGRASGDVLVRHRSLQGASTSRVSRL